MYDHVIINDALFDGAWELESISSYSDEDFKKMYAEKAPKISFDKETNMVQGTNSCNGYSAEYTIDGNSIAFGEPGPTTMMYCGEGEGVFLDLMKKVDSFQIESNDQLILSTKNKVLMRFTKK